MQSKLEIQDESAERAVSPVIGVILMVAITVILAAVIAAFVLDIGSTSANPQAGFTINEAGDDINVQINSIERLDTVEIDCGDDGDSLTAENTTVGATMTVDTTVNGCDRGSLTIIGTYDGNEAVMN